MAEPIYLVGYLREMIILTIMIDQTWTLQGLFQNVGHGHDKKKIGISNFLTTLNQLVQLLTLKKETDLTNVLIFINDNDVNRERYG